MLDFFSHFKIKYADLPVIFVYWGIYYLLIIIGLFLTNITIVILLALCLLPVLVVVLHFHFYRATEQIEIRHQQKVQAYFSLYNLIDFRLPLPYMTGWAATPELALAIYDLIRTKQPARVVELGSGISSLIVAYGLQQNKYGKLLSVDHDREYGQKTRRMLRKHQVYEQAAVCYAPLKLQRIGDQQNTWYDCSAIQFPNTIDLLIVDGPPTKTQVNARYPALNFFYSKLSADAAIVIHDALRKTESETVQKWLREHPEFSKETIHSEKGIVILQKEKPDANART